MYLLYGIRIIYLAGAFPNFEENPRETGCESQTMGCCGSKQFAEEPGAYEERRANMLAAAEARNKENEMRGIKNPRAAQKLRQEQAAPQRDTYQSRKDDQMARDWAS